MFKFPRLVLYKPCGVFALPHRGIVHLQHPGKCLADHESSSLKEVNVKAPLGTLSNQGDPKIFYDFGNVPNGFIEGKLTPFPNNYCNASLVSPTGDHKHYDDEQCEG